MTFPTLAQCVAYINTHIIPNGVEDITGEEHNNVENSLAHFIEFYTLNSIQHLASVSSSTGAVTVTTPITYFTAVPSTLQWPDNVQNEYYFVNGTGNNISFANEFSYVDEYGDVQTTLPARTILHIAKAANTFWIKVSATGGGSSAGLPPQTNHDGEVLITNGTSVSWSSLVRLYTSADFQPDGRTVIDPTLVSFKYFMFVNEVNRYIYNYEDDPPVEFGQEWDYLAGGGFVIEAPWFTSGDANYHIFLMLRGLNS